MQDMSTIQAMGAFAQVVEDASALPLDQQESLIEILRSRRNEQRRRELLADVLESRSDFERGHFRSGTVKELMKEIME